MPEQPSPKPADNLSFTGTVEDFDRAARQSLRAFDRLGEQMLAKSGTKLACRAGCSLCCSLRVDVFAHEVFLVLHHIWSHYAVDDIVALRVRLRSHAAKVRSLTPFQHATTNIQCPLLRHDRCSVYESRPRSCRRHHSQDFAACQYTFDNPTDLEFPAPHDRPLFRALTEAMQEGIEVYARSGFDSTIYELSTALEEALGDPECWKRWRLGEQAFYHASVTPSE